MTTWVIVCAGGVMGMGIACCRAAFKIIRTTAKSATSAAAAIRKFLCLLSTVYESMNDNDVAWFFAWQAIARYISTRLLFS